MKLKPRDIKRYNKIAEKGRKPIMVRVGHNWYTWSEGDPKYGVFLTSQSGRDVEFDFKQIDDIQENKMEKMKSKLREIIREEIQKLDEAGMGRLGTDQSDILSGIVLKNKNKNPKAILRLVLKDKFLSTYMKKLDISNGEMLSYINDELKFAKFAQ